MKHGEIEDVVERLVAPARSAHEHVDGVLVGRLIGFDPPHAPLVTYSGQPTGSTVRADTIVDLHEQHIGSAVVLSFEGGDVHRPIVLGCLRGDAMSAEAGRSTHLEATVDGQRLVIEAANEIVLRCGEASITLTREGRIAIRGNYVVTHAKGVNRIRGGSVEIN